MARKSIQTDQLRAALLGFKESREQMKALKERIEYEQPELVGALGSLDPSGNGLVCDPADTAKGTAFVQQNNPSDFWAMEDVISYLKKHQALWMSCSSRVFDVAKFEAEIANGNITAKQAAKFKRTGNTPTPFIRFGQAKKESL